MKLRAVGLCGVDNSVHPKQVVLYAHSYPFVEFGILFRPDKEGQPRYATPEWVRELSETIRAKNSHTSCRMKLAAHLCERRVDEVLRGDDSFVRELYEWGFGRVQINATAINGVDTSVFKDPKSNFVQHFLEIASNHPKLEFILQQNDETQPLWQGVLDARCETFPANVSMLVDESKGTGRLPKTWKPIESAKTPYSVGYAGGIGPDNIVSVLDQIEEAAGTHPVWIDMESRLRSVKEGKDVFDLDKCYTVINAVCDKKIFSHPDFLREPTN